jgi:carbon-monoxide dehydrogenase large subunit
MPGLVPGIHVLLACGQDVNVRGKRGHDVDRHSENTMNIQNTANSKSAYAIGQPVKRKEDAKLLRGQGRYTDDVNLPGQAYAFILRSTVAHGRIKSINTEAAKRMKGVLGIYTGADVTPYGTLQSALPFKSKDGSDLKKPPRPALPTDKVRFVGDPIACIVAETLAQAKDASEAIEVDIEALPAITTPTQAVAKDAPAIFEDVPGNVCLDFHYGDSEKVDAAFAAAKHKVKLTLQNTRMIVNAIEPRAAIGSYDKANERYTLTSCSQGVMGLKAGITNAMKTTPDKVHIVTGNVGGSFGMKAQVYPEYICILHAAKTLGRPVKWTDERSSSFVSDNHGRAHEQTAELALDAEGHFLAVRLNGYGDLGGFQGAMSPQPPTLNTVRNVISLYRTPLLEVNTKCVFTNTTFVSPYRGAGRPEGNYYMERLVDYAAAECGFDRIELRRKNQIRKSEIPWKSAAGTTYDSGDFPAVLRQALEASDWKGFNKRKRESKKRGRVRGIGVGCYLEVTAPANKEMGGISFDADGGVTIRTGTLDYGQGHATPFAQVLSDRLGVPFDKVRILQGDSDELVAGGGTGGSRSMMNSGQAIVEASAKVIEQGKQIASHALEASAGDIEFKDGRFVVAGTDRAIDIMELSQKVRAGMKLPSDAPQSLDVKHVSDGAPSAYPNGCHVCEVEIDPDTGELDIVSYVVVDDVGTVVNHPVPAKTNPLGVKGCGEAGCAGSLTSIMNAVVDALSEYGIKHIDMPASPARVWQAIQDAKKA